MVTTILVTMMVTIDGVDDVRGRREEKDSDADGITRSSSEF